MAQVTQLFNTNPKKVVLGKNEALAVPQAGNTVLLLLENLLGLEKLFCEVKNVGAQPFDAFIIEGRPHPNADFITLCSAAVDYTSPTGLLLGTSGDLTILAGGATGWFFFDLGALDAIRISASCGNAAGTTTNTYAQGS